MFAFIISEQIRDELRLNTRKKVQEGDPAGSVDLITVTTHF